MLAAQKLAIEDDDAAARERVRRGRVLATEPPLRHHDGTDADDDSVTTRSHGGKRPCSIEYLNSRSPASASAITAEDCGGAYAREALPVEVC
jgi:hypothetical protein